jgi:hypothetical protein
MAIRKGVAWYDVKGEGPARDIFVLLHPPYTAWHLSYAVVGAALAPVMSWSLLGWTVLAFFLAMGIAGHCLDELNGRPLRTTLPAWLLWFLSGLGLGGAMAIGLIVADQHTLWLIPCIVFGGFIVFAYNMEWPRDWSRFGMFRELGLVGFFHRDIWFGIAWGAFPAVTAYLAQTGTLSWPVALCALYALLTSMAQRVLSLKARFWRRKVSQVEGYYLVPGPPPWGQSYNLTKEIITGPYDLALKILNGGVVGLALGLMLIHI